MPGRDALYPDGPLGKAAAPNYCPKPFYFVQVAPSGKVRIPCWSSDPAPLADLMLKWMADFPDEVAVLLKVEQDQPSANGDPWSRYYGTCKKGAVVRAFEMFRDFVLTDSTHQICIRNPETEEYFAFDECGVLWLYPNERKIEAMAASLGFENKLQSLISDQGYWSHILSDSAERRRALVEFLMLEAVDSTPDQPNAANPIQ
jgi:hypothetical protein